MTNKQKVKKSNNNIISASEIGQYYFCSNSWYLQKCGYIPISNNLETGRKKHKQIGRIITNLERKEKNSNFIKYIGDIFFIISILIFLIQVIF